VTDWLTLFLSATSRQATNLGAHLAFVHLTLFRVFVVVGGEVVVARIELVFR